MPHLDVKYRPGKIKEDDLAAVADQLIKIIADHYGENPAFVSLEVISQNLVTRNRKDVDLELDSAPDQDGLRKSVASKLSADLAKTVVDHLKLRGYTEFEVSAWIRIFDMATYHYEQS
jgi:hypothetical protein